MILENFDDENATVGENIRDGRFPSILAKRTVHGDCRFTAECSA